AQRAGRAPADARVGRPPQLGVAWSREARDPEADRGRQASARTRARPRPGAVVARSSAPREPVLPAGPPPEDLVDELSERDAVQVVVEPPSGRDVADDDHTGTVLARRQIAQKAADARDRFAPALPAGEGLVEMGGSILAVRLRRLGVAFAVVALAQSPVEKDRHAARGEGDLGGLEGPTKIGAEHDGEVVAPPSRSQLASLLATTRGEAAVAPTRRDTELVVLPQPMRLEDHRHRPRASGGAPLRRDCPRRLGPPRRLGCAERRSSAHRRCRARRARCHPGPRRRDRRAAWRSAARAGTSRTARPSSAACSRLPRPTPAW